jgi:hypothetical protein
MDRTIDFVAPAPTLIGAASPVFLTAAAHPPRNTLNTNANAIL